MWNRIWIETFYRVNVEHGERRTIFGISVFKTFNFIIWVMLQRQVEISNIFRADLVHFILIVESYAVLYIMFWACRNGSIQITYTPVKESLFWFYLHFLVIKHVIYTFSFILWCRDFLEFNLIFISCSSLTNKWIYEINNITFNLCKMFQKQGELMIM